MAASALARELGALEQCHALCSEDCAALDPREIVEALLTEPAGAVVALPPDDHRQLLEGESVLTRLGPAEDGHDFSVSIRDVGSLEVGAGRSKYYRSIGSFMKVEEKVRVKNDHGHMFMTIQDYEGSEWTTKGILPPAGGSGRCGASPRRCHRGGRRISPG